MRNDFGAQRMHNTNNSGRGQSRPDRRHLIILGKISRERNVIKSTAGRAGAGDGSSAAARTRSGRRRRRAGAARDQRRSVDVQSGAVDITIFARYRHRGRGRHNCVDLLSFTARVSSTWRGHLPARDQRRAQLARPRRRRFIHRNRRIC